MAIVEVTIVPLGTASTSLSPYVAKVHQVAQDAVHEGVHVQLTPMSTILEGELETLLGIVRQMHEVPFEAGAQRVSTSIRIDDRRDKAGTMADKVAAVERLLK